MKTQVISPSQAPHGAFDFPTFQLDQVLPELKKAIVEAQTNLNAVKSHAVAKSTFDNTVLALENAFEKTEIITTLFGNLLSSNSNAQMHAMAPAVSALTSDLSNDLLLDAGIFERVKYVHDHPGSLSNEETKLLDNTYKDFVRNGALLNTSDKEKLREVDNELSRLTPKFQEHLLKATNKFVIHRTSPPAGLSPFSLEQAKVAAHDRGFSSGYAFTLQGPSYSAVMQECSDRSLREEIYFGMAQRCVSGEFDNREILKKILELRHRRSEILGYKTHADFVLERRMAENPQNVHQFLNRLVKVVKPAAQKDLNEIRAFAERHQISDLKPWDVTYFSERMKEEKFKMDPETLRPYFPLETVLKGTFEIAKKLYGLDFTESTEYPVYFSDVRVFEVTREKEFIGLLYCDFFPRTSKQGGAWMTNFVQQGLFSGKVLRPHVSLVCNFPAPMGQTPSLLTMRDVRTLLHEFGHGLHSLLSNVRFRSLSGTNVLWDFVELPSQFMENWVSEQESLALLSGHYQTHQPLPLEEAAKIRASQNFHSSLIALRQLSFGMLDMALHSTPVSEWSDIEEFERETMKEAILIAPPKGCSMAASFGHIFSGGYAAGYYSYKWAEVLEADAFEHFKEQGLFSREVAQKFYDHVLSRGGTEHPKELYKKFRGRDADLSALLKREGFSA